MHKVELSYSLTGRRSAGAAIRNPLIELLQAVRAQGSISGAAKSLGQSYRHVWGELKRWEAELDRSLIVWDKGQPARLTAFGDKLLWAERQAQARLAPQIDSLHADLERAFAVAFDDATHVLTLHASHDDALALLREQAAARARLHLDIRFMGSVDAISALNEGRCTIAGFHTPPQPAPGSRAQRTYQPLLRPGEHKIIGFARRRQGLVVAAGNPLGITGLSSLTQGRVRYVNRALGTGTRLVAEDLLAGAGIAPASIEGWDRIEPSHAAVAEAVASGSADAGMAIESATQGRGLGFVPLLEEDYYLVCLRSVLEQPATQALREVLASREWQERLGTLAGYEPLRSGEVLSLSRQLPWWKFKTSKGSTGSPPPRG